MQRRIIDIEILRGLAIALVLLHQFKNLLIHEHSTVLNRLFSFFDFWIGIDIFFAISGFVITAGWLAQVPDNPTPKQFFIEATAFWIKRIWRLWPAAWLWLGLILVAVVYGNRSGVFGSLTANAEATVVALLQVANFRYVSWLREHFEYGASVVYWTLSQLEQFYILLPLLAFVLRQRLVATLVAIIVVKGILALLFPTIDNTLLKILLRSDALLLGILLAFWSRQSSHRLFEPLLFKNRFARWTLWPVILICLCALASEHMRILPDPFRYSVIGVLATVPVFIASYDRNYIVGPGPLRLLLLWLGSRSYSIFLVHVPAFLLTKELWFRALPANTIFDGAFNVQFALTAAALTLCFSELNFRAIEKPFRRRGVLAAEKFRAAHALSAKAAAA